MVASAAQIHHRIPRRLLKVWDGGHGSSLEPEDFAAWIEWEEEAYRYGVDPEISREDLAALIKGSTVELGVEAHRAAHSEAGDFARWGRLGVSRLSLCTGRGGSCSWRVGAGRRSPPPSSKKHSHSFARGGPSMAAPPAPPSGTVCRQHQGAPNALPAAEQPGEGARTPPILRPGIQTHTHALVRITIR